VRSKAQASAPKSICPLREYQHSKVPRRYHFQYPFQVRQSSVTGCTIGVKNQGSPSFAAANAGGSFYMSREVKRLSRLSNPVFDLGCCRLRVRIERQADCSVYDTVKVCASSSWSYLSQPTLHGGHSARNSAKMGSIPSLLRRYASAMSPASLEC
jgi:hypothetical protein